MTTFNKKEWFISLAGLFFSILTYIFGEEKWPALVIFFATMVVMSLVYTYKKRGLKSFDYVQKKAKILFIDDKVCQIVTNLKRNNFDVKKIDDVTSPATDKNLKWSNVIFVDYKGVGKKVADKKEGLGLIKELKKIYGKNKRYVIYSTVQNFDGLTDFPFIRKNASYDEYISRITQEVSKL